jgi:hypothetical protein
MASSPMGPPSPTGSAATISLPFVKVRPIKYDNLGPRTSIYGVSESRLSLNNLPDNTSSTPSTPNNHFHPHLMTGTLGRHNMLRSTPTPSMLGQPISHFAPIQEVDPTTSPTEIDLGNKVNVDHQQKHHNDDTTKEITPHLPRSNLANKSKTETPKTNMGNNCNSGDDQDSRSPNKPNKKVPPKAPPKPRKKKDIIPSEEQTADIPENTAIINEPVAAIAGDDGTEV